MSRQDIYAFICDVRDCRNEIKMLTPYASPDGWMSVYRMNMEKGCPPLHICDKHVDVPQLPTKEQYGEWSKRTERY